MKHRIFVDGGKVKIYPPTHDVVVPLMRQLGQDYHFESIRHPSSVIPLFQQTKRLLVGVTIDEAKKLTVDQLWQVHDSKTFSNHGISLLDLKIEICKRLYSSCMLCGHGCGVNRYKHKGKCGLGIETRYEYIGEIIGEESVINPAAGIGLYGCTISCCSCHASSFLLIENCKNEGKILGPDLWLEIDYRNCQTIEFNAAGDPTPHLLAIFNVLNQAPSNMNHPIVWSSNSYASRQVWKILDGIADVFLVDMKYGNDKCAHELAGCTNHNNCARETMESLKNIPGRKIIRWLLLPGHVECCGKEIVKLLSQYGFCFSLLDDFQDDYKMVFKRKNTEEEIRKAKELINQYRLKDINNPEIARHFWNT